MLTQNQISDVFQSSLGRAPTDYEVQTYSNASPQTLAGLKNYYGSLNTTNSIADYLKYTGVDPSTAGSLGQKYGIQGIGTAQGNTSLLEALKAGKPPSTPTVSGTVAQPDTAKTTDTTATTTTGPTTLHPGDAGFQPAAPAKPTATAQYDTDGNYIGTNGPTSVSGSIAGAAGTGDPYSEAAQVTAQKNVSDAYAAQQAAQQAVADIDKSLASSEQDLQNEIARGGGHVDASQLKSLLYERNAPLLAQRKELVSEYTSANQNYQKATSDYNTYMSNYQKNQTLQQGQEKIDAQQTQFDEKFQQAGWKEQKVNTYDEYGNVVGQQTVWTQNPGDTSGFDSNGNQVTIGSGSAGAGITQTNASGGGTAGKNVASTLGLDPSTPIATAIANVGIDAVVNAIIKNEGGSPAGVQNNPGNIKFSSLPGQTDSGVKATDGGTFASYASADAGKKAIADNVTKMMKDGDTIQSFMDRYAGQTGTNASASGATSPSGAPETVPLTTSPSVDVTSPGYTTATVTLDGKDTQLTQSYIDQIAVAAIMAGGTIPSSVSRATKGLPVVQMNAIKQRMGQLDPGGNLALNKTEAQAWGKTLQTQIAYATTLQRALGSADADFKQILQTYNGTGINDSSMPISNIIANSTKYNLGSGDVSAFKASLAELANAYQQVFSRSGAVTDSVRAQSQDILDGNISIANLQKVSDQLQALGKVDLDQANATVKSVEGSYGSIVPGASPTGGSSFAPRGSTSANDFVESTFQTMYPGQSEASLKSQYGSGLQAGEQLAFDNSTGEVVAVNPKKDDMTKYTPI